MKVTSVRVLTTNEGNLMAYADITIDNCFRVRDLQIFWRPRGYFVAMPQVKQEDGMYREIAFAINAKTRKLIEEAVIDEYKKVAAKPVLGTRHTKEATKCHPSKRQG
jgi:stage V sporulation protein G